MHILQCSIPLAGYPRGVASRHVCDEKTGETLLATSAGELRLLVGGDARSGLEFGPALELYESLPAHKSEANSPRPKYEPTRSFRDPTWDPFSSSFFLLDGHAVMRLSNNTVSLVAGHRHEEGEIDGHGSAARFGFARFVVSDGVGSLFLGDGLRICRLKLPTVWCTGTATELSRASSTFEAEVSTLLMAPEEVVGLAYHECQHRGSSLVYATDNAVYRLPLGAPDAIPVLLAGRENVQGATDGHGSDARFVHIAGLAVDGEGSAYVADVDEEGSLTALRKVTAEGTVTTVAPYLEGHVSWPAVLPNGYLAMCSLFPGALLVLDLGLQPRAAAVTAAALPAASPGPPRRTLPADLGALLDRQPDGTSDLTLEVAGRTFAVHRGILAARSDYFRQRLAGDFADGSEQQLSLPDADADAFALVLRYMYTGDADVPPALLQPVAELADRLLLPELRGDVHAQLLQVVQADTVVDLLIWTEGRGPQLQEFLSSLIGWYLAHQLEVMEQSPEAVKRLMVSCPDLAFELHMAAAKLARRD